MTQTQPAAAGRFFAMLDRIETGTLHLHTPDGQHRIFGGGEPEAHMEIRDWRTLSALALRGDVGLGESYAEEWWDTPDLDALAGLAIANEHLTHGPFGGAFLQRLLFLLSDRVLRRNSRSGSRRNIRSHYDLGNDFYSRWLDPSMTYSSAIFGTESDTLEDAQWRKYDRLLEVTGEGGPRTLEIGCGWGGFAERAADQNREVTAITVSDAQHEYATKRLDGRADIRLQDYRDVEGQFDSIVSIEMIEAVGQRYWPAYFGAIGKRLAPKGRAALQAIIIEDHAFDYYRKNTDFIRQYTFPGGMLISPDQIRRCAEKAGMAMGEMFRFGQDYARTLRQWSVRFGEIAPELEERGYKRPFLRGWRFYLDTCAAGFAANRNIDVVQVELQHA